MLSGVGADTSDGAVIRNLEDLWAFLLAEPVVETDFFVNPNSNNAAHDPAPSREA
jgi:hypothetical protein